MSTSTPSELTPKEHLIEAFKKSGFHYVERSHEGVTWLFVGDDLANEDRLIGRTKDTVPVAELLDRSCFRLNKFEFDATSTDGHILSCG
jgi:hypothetical protein